jgi:phosphoglycerate dehydrogenase-like enzyme
VGERSRFGCAVELLLRRIPFAKKARARSSLESSSTARRLHQRWLVLVGAGGVGTLVETVSDRLRCTSFASAILPQQVSVLTATCTVSRAA